MEIVSYKSTALTLTEHDSWMLENILVEFLRAKGETEKKEDSFDKFAIDLSAKLNRESKKGNDLK